MKLERINAAAQIELPNAKSAQSQPQRFKNKSANTGEKKNTAENGYTRPLWIPPHVTHVFHETRGMFVNYLSSRKGGPSAA